MPRRLATTLAAAALALHPALAAPSQRAEPEGKAQTIHLDRDEDSGYTRPRIRDPACLVEALERRPDAAGFDGKVRFTVQRDGQLSGLELLPAPPPAMARAIEAAFLDCPWIEGMDRQGGKVVVQVTQPLRVRGGAAGAERRTQGEGPGAPPPPVVMDGGSLRLDGDRAPGFRRPVLEDPACLQAALQGQAATAGLENTVKLAVMRDGSVGALSFLSPVAPEVERAVAAAFAACPWRPALDPEGVALAVWVVQPLKVAPLPPPPPAQRPLFP